MKDDKPKQGSVPLDTAYVKQHHRLAAGSKTNGQKLPSNPENKKLVND